MKKLLIALTVASIAGVPAFGESLFKMGISQNTYPIQPKSLFSTIKAKTIGDLVTVVVNETITASDDLSLDIGQESSTTDNFSSLLNKLVRNVTNYKKDLIPSEVNGFGGANDIGNSAKIDRTTTLTDTITAQVVQVLPNGNLIIQGKKTIINAGENVNIIVSGIVNPRFLNNLGQINSNNVANLQLAVTGQGTISKSGNEGVVNKFIRYLY